MPATRARAPTAEGGQQHLISQEWATGHSINFSTLPQS